MLRAELHAMLDGMEDRSLLLQRALDGMRQALHEEERRLRRLELDFPELPPDEFEAERLMLEERLEERKLAYAHLMLRAEALR